MLLAGRALAGHPPGREQFPGAGLCETRHEFGGGRRVRQARREGGPGQWMPWDARQGARGADHAEALAGAALGRVQVRETSRWIEELGPDRLATLTPLLKELGDAGRTQ